MQVEQSLVPTDGSAAEVATPPSLATAFDEPPPLLDILLLLLSLNLLPLLLPMIVVTIQQDGSKDLLTQTKKVI